MCGSESNSGPTPAQSAELGPAALCDALAVRSEATIRTLADSAPVLIWTAAADQTWEYFNKGWLDFTGRTLDDELGSGWLQGIHPDDHEHVTAAYREAFATRGQLVLEYRLRHHDGAYRWVLATSVARFGSDGNFAGIIGSCVDITRCKSVQRELQQLLAASDAAHAQLTEQTRRLHHLAGCDPLTGVFNRRSFREQFEREWVRSLRYERPLACIMLDVDFFKKVNDAHGHAAGDASLKQVAEVLAKRCRPSDVICRYGGEEFCIMAPETDEEGAAMLAERLRSALAAAAIEVGDRLLCVTASFGVAQRDQDVDNVDNLIERADQALYVAKRSGRNRVVRFGLEEAFAEMVARHEFSRVLAGVTARDLLTPTPCIRCDESIARAVDFLLRNRLISAPVVDEHGRLVGFISKRDLMLLDVEREIWGQPVGDVMKTNVVCYQDTTPGQEVFQFLCRVSMHRVVIVRHGRPIGIISPGSLLRHFQQRLAAESECLGAVS